MMDKTKVQIGDDVLLDIGTHSDWYISAICYDNESVNVELRRKIDRNNKWWVTEQDEPHIVGKHADVIIIADSRLTAKCLNCANGGSYKCSKCDGEMYFKNEPQTIAEDINRRVEMGKKEWNARHIEDEPQTEPLQTCSVNGRPYSECSSCEHFKCTADEPQTERSSE